MRAPWIDPERWRQLRASSLAEQAHYYFPKPGALTIDRRDEYASPPPVRVVALAATWCVGGRPVRVGETYPVPPDVAASLEVTGKARRV
jgi:hypothetical protein